MVEERERRAGARVKAAVLLAVLFVVVSIAMAFPRIDSFTTSTVGDYADGYFVQWAMAWDLHALAENPRRMFDANIFWPTTNSLALSESLIPPALAVGILRAFDEEAAFNAVYLLTWIVSMFGMYLLAFWFVPNRAAAVLAAIVFTFSAPRLANYGHFQLTFACLLPWAVYLFFRYKQDRRLWQSALLGLLAAVTALSVIYYGVFLALAFAVLFLLTLAIDRKAVTARFVGGLALAGLIAAVITGPVAYRYLQLPEEQIARPDYEKDLYSAKPVDLITSGTHSYVYSHLRGPRTDRRNVALFPGALAIGLGIFGASILISGRNRSQMTVSHRRDLAIFCVLGLVLFILSFGRKLSVGEASIPLPYDLIDGVPGISAIRVVSRFFVFPLMTLACLAGAGFAWMTARFKAPQRLILAAVVGSLMLGEYATVIRFVPEISGRNATAVNIELGRRTRGNVLELPIRPSNDIWWGYTEAPRMVLSRLDWQPRINGYSGLAPPGYDDKVATFTRLERGAPAFTDALEALTDNKIRYVVLRTAPITPFVSGSTPHRPGIAYYDEATTNRVISAIPSDMIVRMGRYGDAVLIELRVRGGDN
ncbi:MAG TPA: DUF6044 family protein [Actinomycetota bacterium]|nr:DUF6044 family protein [Actinomycetota bacterium]